MHYGEDFFVMRYVFHLLTYYFQGKEVAVNIIPLPSGTVIFEDISIETKRGKIVKTLKSNKRASDPLGGRIQYETPKGYVLKSASRY
jgi:hypothetical protein